MGAIANAEEAYANARIGGDPETAVFTVGAGDPFRMHVLMPSAVGRGSTFDLHGHVWQRDPYVCVGDDDLGVPGKCDMGNYLLERKGQAYQTSRSDHTQVFSNTRMDGPMRMEDMVCCYRSPIRLMPSSNPAIWTR